MQSTAPLERQLDHHKTFQKFIKIQTGTSKFKVKLSFLKRGAFPVFRQTQTISHDALLQDDHAKAANCIARIADPLWKNICTDLLNMMGPASVLKIWKSKLGEFSSFDKALELTCETEEVATFVHQYDFVILGSLQRYFPALKGLRVSI